jgi:hypothetical protein
MLRKQRSKVSLEKIDGDTAQWAIYVLFEEIPSKRSGLYAAECGKNLG